MKDLKAAAGAALKSTRVGVGVDPRDTANPWAVFGNYVDRVVIQCVNDLTPKWRARSQASTSSSGINATRWSKPAH